MGDKEYLTLFQYVFIPIITEFNPDLLIISAGFDCAAGDLLGPMRVSPKGFAHMMRMCLDAVPNRVIAVLEGGYDLTCTATGAEACIATMLGDPVPLLKDAPLSTGGLADIMKCIDSLKPYWKCLRALQNDRRWRELIAPHAQRLAQYREGAPQ